MKRSSLQRVLGKKKEADVDVMKKKGTWTADEDEKLVKCVLANGDKKWRTLPPKAGLQRCGKSCRLRWLNYLRPGIKRGNISEDEEDLIIRLHNLLGNRWSIIAGRLPGRTDNEIKNHWNTHLSKRSLTIEDLNKKQIPSLNGINNADISPPTKKIAPNSNSNSDFSPAVTTTCRARTSASDFDIEHLLNYHHGSNGSELKFDDDFGIPTHDDNQDSRFQSCTFGLDDVDKLWDW